MSAGSINLIWIISQLNPNFSPVIQTSLGHKINFTILFLVSFSLNNLSQCIKEINRVGKKSYIMVESYRNDQELFNLQCWALTCKTFLDVKDWLWFLKNNNYKGDFEFIFFE